MGTDSGHAIMHMRFWKKGSGEVFGFICVSPIMVLLLVMLISVVQISSLKEKLEYTTYVACRAAVVSDTLADAKKAAKAAAEADLAGYSEAYSGNVRVRLTYPMGSGSGEKDWKKGNYIQCDVSVKASPLSPDIVSKRIKCSITMAIEKPEDPSQKESET